MCQQAAGSPQPKRVGDTRSSDRHARCVSPVVQRAFPFASQANVLNVLSNNHVKPFNFIRDRTLYCDSESMFSVFVLLPSLFLFVYLLLVDSGACCTCVSLAFAKRFKFVIEEADSSPLYSACGKQLSVCGYVSLVIYFSANNVMKVKSTRDRRLEPGYNFGA